MHTPSAHPPSAPSSPDRSNTRAALLARPGVRHLGFKQHGIELADAIACNLAGKNPCFAVLFWSADRLNAAELFHTDTETRAVLDHGRGYALRSMALPPEVLRCFGEETDDEE